MVKSNVFLYLSFGVLVASAASLATVSQDTADEPKRAAGDRVEAWAAAYWSDRSGQLPPNQPITKRPAPERSRQTPPQLTHTHRPLPAAPSLPAGRSQ